MTDRGRQRRWRFAIGPALAAVTLLGSVLALEGALRAMRFTHELGPRPRELAPWVVYDPVLGRRNVADYREPERGLFINSLGLRGDEIPVAKPPGTLRIVCLGDSTTFGIHRRSALELRVDAAYPFDLARELRDAGYDRVEVVNAGTLGHTTSAAIVLVLAKIAALSPDVLVVRLGNNDHSRILGDAPQLSTDLEYAILRHLPRALLDWETVRLAFHVHRWALSRQPWAMRGVKVPLERFETNLHRLLDIAASLDARVMFLDFPYRHLASGESPDQTFPNFLMPVRSLVELHRLHDRYQDTVARVARETGTPLVETAEALYASPIPPFSEYDLSHPNEVGTRIIGRRVFEELERLGWLAR